MCSTVEINPFYFSWSSLSTALKLMWNPTFCCHCFVWVMGMKGEGNFSMGTSAPLALGRFLLISYCFSGRKEKEMSIKGTDSTHTLSSYTCESFGPISINIMFKILLKYCLWLYIFSWSMSPVFTKIMRALWCYMLQVGWPGHY